MHSIINSTNFQQKIKGKYSLDFVESIIEKISLTPTIGKKFSDVNNLYKLDMGLTLNKKAEYHLVYHFENKNQAIFIVNIFKNKEKDVLSKVISSLISESQTIA